MNELKKLLRNVPHLPKRHREFILDKPLYITYRGNLSKIYNEAFGVEESTIKVKVYLGWDEDGVPFLFTEDPLHDNGYLYEQSIDNLDWSVIQNIQNIEVILDAYKKAVEYWQDVI